MRKDTCGEPRPALPGTGAIGTGFSLIELLMVLSLISVLAAILLPTLERGMEQARCLACSNNLRQFHAAAVIYSTDAGGTLPWYPARDSSHGTTDNKSTAASTTAECFIRGVSVSPFSGATGWAIFMRLGLTGAEQYRCPSATVEPVVGGSKPGVGIHYAYRYNSWRTMFVSSEQDDAGVALKTPGNTNPQTWLNMERHLRQPFAREQRASRMLFSDFAGDAAQFWHGNLVNAVRHDGGIRTAPILWGSSSYWTTPMLTIDAYVK